MSSTTATKYVNKALSYAGYLEKKTNSKLEDFTANAGSNNYTRFNRDYGKYTGVGTTKWQAQPWCAMFVSTVLVEALDGDVTKAKEMFCGNLYAGVPTAYSAFKKKGRIYSSPKVGDLIFFFNGSRSSYAHIGLVYKVSASTVYTVEGNTSSTSGVVANGGSVAKKQYNIKYNMIAGYGRPIGYATTEDVKDIPTTEVNKTYNVNVNTFLNVRSGPGTNYSSVDKLYKNDEVKVSKMTSNGWGYIPALSGWISLTYAKKA